MKRRSAILANRSSRLRNLFVNRGSSSILLILISIAVTISGCINYRANYHQPRFGIAAKDAKSITLNGEPVSIPVNAPSISQGFNPAPVEKTPGDFHLDHPGIDIVGERGTPILAAADGTVLRSAFDPMFGNQVSIIHHQKSNGKTIKTNYYHLDQKSVIEGDRILMGDQIGGLGTTGVLASFLHVHFEVRENIDGQWKPLNPHFFWVDGIGRVTCFSEQARAKSERNEQLTLSYPAKCKD